MQPHQQLIQRVLVIDDAHEAAAVGDGMPPEVDLWHQQSPADGVEFVIAKLGQGQPIDLVFVDMNFDRDAMNGLWILRELSELTPAPRLILRAAREDNRALLALVAIAGFDLSAWLDRTGSIYDLAQVLTDINMGNPVHTDLRRNNRPIDLNGHPVNLTQDEAQRLLLNLVPTRDAWSMLTAVARTPDGPAIRAMYMAETQRPIVTDAAFRRDLHDRSVEALIAFAEIEEALHMTSPQAQEALAEPDPTLDGKRVNRQRNAALHGVLAPHRDFARDTSGEVIKVLERLWSA